MLVLELDTFFGCSRFVEKYVNRNLLIGILKGEKNFSFKSKKSVDITILKWFLTESVHFFLIINLDFWITTLTTRINL